MSRQKIPQRVKKAVLAYWSDPEAETIYCFHCLDEGWCPGVYESRRLPEGFEWDHLHPVSKGGTNDPDNIVISCRECNRRKRDKVDWISPIAQWHIDNPRESAA